MSQAVAVRTTTCRVDALVVLLLVAATACSSSGTTHAATTNPSTTTSPPAAAAQAYSRPGPFPVGVATLTLADGVKVEVWYPAIAGTTGTVTYDVRTMVPPVVGRLLTADVPATHTIAGQRNAAVADGAFPLVLFSHGFSGFRQQSSFLTSHLASWGFVVAAPDHWSRDLYHVLGKVLGAPKVKATDPVDDLRQTRALMTREDTRAGSLFKGHVDTAHVAAVGHSAGGATVMQFAADAGVDGYVSLASGFLTAASSSATTTTGAPVLPDKPSLFVAGTADHVAPYATVTAPAFAAAPAPSRFWLLDGVGHNGFDDVCTFGGGKGLIGVAEASGLGSFLNAQPQFRRLGDDGCLAPDVPVTRTYPIIDHVVTAWLRALFGIDAHPVGLGPEVAGRYAVRVQIRAK